MPRYLPIALVLLAAGAAQAAEKTLDRTFAVSPGGSLMVDADGAEVRVSGTDGNQVVVHMVTHGSDEALANTTLEAYQKGDDVSVTMKRTKRSWFSWGNGNNNEEIEVKVPRRYAVDVSTSGGSIELRDTSGITKLHTSGGDISAKNVTGNVELRTSGGSIHADTIRGDVDAGTSGGEVRLLHVDGKISGRSSGGSVHCSLVGANRGISATTSGGEIELTLPPGTMANIEATTSGGQVTSELPVTSTAFGDSHLAGSLNGGGARILARTSGGSISLRAEK
jgi:DUF4097 and DUF4098 domain-containing protein YvlB